MKQKGVSNFHLLIQSIWQRQLFQAPEIVAEDGVSSVPQPGSRMPPLPVETYGKHRSLIAIVHERCLLEREVVYYDINWWEIKLWTSCLIWDILMNSV